MPIDKSTYRELREEILFGNEPQNTYSQLLNTLATLPNVQNVLSSHRKKRLQSLFDKLCSSIYCHCHGPYPADHGEKHVLAVTANLLSLLDHGQVICEGYIEALLAATLVHDCAMKNLTLAVNSGEDNKTKRRNHAELNHIRVACERILQNCEFTNLDEILTIASSHAGDSHFAAQKKLTNLEGGKYAFLKPPAVLLQAADFFDLGPHRLHEDAQFEDWYEDQLEHLLKHNTISIEIQEKEIVLTSRRGAGKALTNRVNFQIEQLYETVLRDASNMVQLLASSNLGKWNIRDDWEAHGARVAVLVRGTFRSAFEEGLAKNPANSVFEVDLMGHSLLGLLEHDGDGLIASLQGWSSPGELRVRVLMLDPSHETQQMQEVADAQSSNEAEGGRCILPNYGSQQEGDILKSISKLRSWAENLPNNANFEVRLTQRLMYANLNRFGSSMVVTPYAGRGATKASSVLLTREGLSLYETYCREFNSIWNDPQTEPLLRAPRKTAPAEPRGTHPQPPASNLDYDGFFSSEGFQDRMKRWFSGEFTPPLEVEIQTSPQCQLRCSHCIGAHLGHVRRWNVSETADIKLFETIFGCNKDRFCVERVRISGLYGDPFYDEETSDVSCTLIESAKKHSKKVVVFTNGLGLDEEVRKRLTACLEEGDTCHVSVDAASEEEYSRSKRPKSTFAGVLKKIENNLCALAADRKFHLGVGFVLTEDNVGSLEKMVEWSKTTHADFARFKPDVRGPLGLSWSTLQRMKKECGNLARNITTGIRIYFTDSTWLPGSPGVQKRCWLQLLCPAIAGDGKVYVCDHRVGRGEPIGDLKKEDFEIIWKRHWSDSEKWMTDPASRFPDVLRRGALCAVCPPFGSYINRKVEAMRVSLQDKA